MPRKTTEQKQAETRDALTRAAVDTFTLRGYHAASLDEISERAGYSTGAVYSNFAGKEGLFLACVEHRGTQQRESWERFIAAARAGGAGEDDVAAITRSVLLDRGWRRAVLEFTIAPKSEQSRTQLLASQQGWRQIVRRMLEAIVIGSDLHPAVDPDTGADLVTALFDGLTQDASRSDSELAALIAVSVRLVLGSHDPIGNVAPRQARAAIRRR